MKPNETTIRDAIDACGRGQRASLDNMIDEYREACSLTYPGNAARQRHWQERAMNIERRLIRFADSARRLAAETVAT